MKSSCHPERSAESACSTQRQAPRCARNSRAACRDQRGYTLLEVIVAFAILALGLTLLLGTLSGAAQQVRWAEDAGRAALHAQSLLDDIGVGEALQPGQRDGDFENGRYRWSLQVVPYRDPLLPPALATNPAAPRLLQVSLRMQWGKGEDPRQRLQLESLRLVVPDPVQATTLP